MASMDDVRIEIAKPIHREGILIVARDGFVKGEPIRQATGTTWKQVRDSWEKRVDDCLQYPHSHVAITGENTVVGIRLSRIMNLQNYHPSDSINDFMLIDSPVRGIADQVTKDWAKLLVDEKGKTCKMVLQFLSLAVLPEYGGRGIAQRMCVENMKLGEKLGCEYCIVEASNYISQRIFDKLGFTTVAQLAFADYRDQNGKQPLVVQDAKQVGSKFQLKKLKTP